MTKKTTSLLYFIALIFAVQAISSFATISSVGSWYQGLNRVSWNPPDWVFGPVWTILYLMIAISGWLAWNSLSGRKINHPAMHWYFLQLFLNFMWSMLFFGLRSPTPALIDIVLLIIAIAVTMKKFMRLNKKAALLLVPYFLWVCYASTLNAGIVYLN